MNNIIKVDFGSGSTEQQKINIAALKSNNRKLDAKLIAPAQIAYEDPALQDHSAEPIKSVEDVMRVSRYLISNGRYRDNMLFIVGINFGLRYSDLIQLRFGNLITPDFVFKDTFAVFEKKTRNTKKQKVNRYITINDAVIEAVTLYLEHKDGVSLSDFMFMNEASNFQDLGKPLSLKSVDRILKGIGKDLGLGIRISSHTLRKTFCYHQMLMSHNDGRKLLLLQKMLNHSTPAQTLNYIGITSEEIEEAYRKLNLGSEKYNYLVDSAIIERTEVLGIG